MDATIYFFFEKNLPKNLRERRIVYTFALANEK